MNIYCCHLFAQQPFTAGNIVVYRVGDGASTLSSNAAPVFLDEYTQGGTLVQSIAMPTAPNGSHHRLTAKGTDEEGLLNLSANGRYLIVTGGNTEVGTVPGGTAGIIGVVDFNGKINTTTAVTDYNTVSGGMQLRSAASDDGKRFWFGRFNELRYTTLGSTTSTLLGNTGNYMTGFSIANGQLYVALETPSPRIRQVGTGLPTTGGQTLTGLPGFGSASARSPKHFAFADLDANVPGVDVLYVADRGNSVEGGIRKFSLVGGTWVVNGVIGSPADQYHGLTVDVSGNTVTVFATRLGANGSTTWGGELMKLVDNSGYNGALTSTPVVMATVTPANNMSFRGVALVPQPAPFTAGNIVVYRVGDGSSTLTSNAAPVFLDEYTRGGTLVQSIAMPTAPNGSHHRLTAKGTEEEGLLTLSSNGQNLIVPGGNTPVGTVPGGTAGIIGVVDFNGKINTTTAVTDYNTVSGGMQLRSAASDDGKRFWFGRFNELRYTTLGSTTSTLIGTTGNYMTGFSIADGQLFVALETPSPRIRQVGTGLPTTGGQTLTGLPGFGSASARSPRHFAFADLDATVPGVDVLYVADRGNSVEGGIRKFSLVGGNWVANGVIGSPADQYHGLTVDVSGNTVTVFATRLGANGSTTWGGELVKLIDNSGYNGALTAVPVVMATVTPANVMSYRGVALVPQGCLPVLKLLAKDVTASQAKLSWLPPLAGGSAYEYAITESETPPATGTGTSNMTVDVSGLTNDVIYYAHVRTVCNALSRSAWATTSFKTGCNAPDAPSISAAVTATGMATIRWNKAFGAASYQYVLSRSETMPVTGTPISDTFFTVPVDAVSKYTVFVRSDCGNNAFSAWAKASFSTNCLQPSVTFNLTGGNTVANWRKINNATRYEYALTKGASKPLSGTYTTDSFHLIAKIDQGAGYYFHCRTVCNTGVQSDWTSVPFHLQGMEAFPNPVSGSFTLRVHGALGKRPVVHITNALGKKIAQVQMNGNSTMFDTRLWQSGVYFVHYGDGTNTYVLKVMKKNEH